MLLDEIMRYSHKKIVITVKNDNISSLVDEVTLRVNLNIEDDESIAFQIKDGDWLSHQQIDNNFFILMPNNLNQNTIIYAYIFPKELYESEEDQQIFSIYDFEKIYNHLVEHPGKNQKTTVNPGSKDEYNAIKSDVIKYNFELDEQKRLTVRSQLDENNKLINKDPNYKNYETDTNENKTKKGMFPLSSRYRSKQNIKAPNLNDNNTKWISTVENDNPTFEVKIHRRNLSPIITEALKDNNNNIIEIPTINIYLDYEYLPSSTEYHQHYYGFEGDEETENKDVNVLEGDNLNLLNPAFGSQNNNYRIINWGDKGDTKKSIYVHHGKEIPIDMSNARENDCKWEKNKCYNYYSYNTDGGNNYCDFYIPKLKEGHNYSFKFFMFIPSDTNDNYCKIEVHTSSGLESNQYVIDPKFYNKDKQLLNQWIYHEIPFVSGQTNYIQIIGPENKASFFFANMSIQEMARYTPTLKYTERGLTVSDTDDNTGELKYKTKPNGEVSTAKEITPSSQQQTFPKTELPTPYNDIIISIENDLDLIYDQITKKLFFIHTDRENSIYVNNGKLYFKHPPNAEMNLNYEDGILYGCYSNYLTASRGPGNYFDFYITDKAGNKINTGTVTISIYKNKNDEAEWVDNYRDSHFNEPIPVKNGVISLKNVNLEGLDVTNQYSRKIIENLLENQEIYGQNGRIENEQFIVGDKNTWAYLKNGWNNNKWELSFRIYDENNVYLRDSFAIILPKNATSMDNCIKISRYNQFYIYKNGEKIYEDIYGNSFSAYLRNHKITISKISETEYQIIYKEYSDNEQTNVTYEKITHFTYDGFKDIDKVCLGAHAAHNFYKGSIRIANIELRECVLKPFYFKFKYEDECTYRSKTIFKRLLVKEKDLAIRALVNKSLNNMTQNEINTLMEEQTSFDIITCDGIPIKITAYVYDQLQGLNNPIKDMGWCELSINDKKHQSTLLDYDGRADFYLDLEDVKCEEKYVIKIEYFTQYNKPLCFVYFDLELDTCYNMRPTVPIIVKTVSSNGSVKYIENGDECSSINDDPLKYDDYILQCIETGPHVDYSVTIKREVITDGISNGEEEIFFKNVNYEQQIIDTYKDLWKEFVIPDINYTGGEGTMQGFSNNFSANEVKFKYTIITTNKKDLDTSLEINDKYRENRKTFTIIKTK